MSINKKQIWLPLLLSVSLLIGMIFGYKLHENMGDFAPRFGKKKDLHHHINEILALIESKYVDSISAETLQNNTIESLINQLDPHSYYIPASEVEGMNDELQGNYHGIGIQYELLNDTVTVISVFDQSPAQTAGLQTGDKILKVDTIGISGRKLNESDIKNTIRGKKGDYVNLAIIRNNKSMNLSVQRSKILSDNIDAAYFTAPGIGYIRIARFSGNTYEEFMEHLERLKKEGLQKLILDLRDNGGGMLDDAVQIADEFLDGNKEIVRTKGVNMPLEIYAARRPGLFETGQLTILINENTASASEVLAGAVQDWNRGTIIGRRSFGKGLVQEQFTLSDGSAVRLTVARYFTPLGRSIQKPYHSGNDNDYNSDISDRLKNGQLYNGNTPAHKGKIFVRTDGQKLYSEEGISPDIFIPADSAYYHISEQNTLLHETLTQIALQFFMMNKDRLAAIKKPEELSSVLQNDAFISKAIGQINISQTSKQKTGWELVLLKELKYILSWICWNKEGYYKISNADDPVIQSAISALNKSIN